MKATIDGKEKSMKTTEEEFIENRCLHRWIDQKTLNDLVKLAVGIGILMLIRLFTLHYF